MATSGFRSASCSRTTKSVGCSRGGAEREVRAPAGWWTRYLHIAANGRQPPNRRHPSVEPGHADGSWIQRSDGRLLGPPGRRRAAIARARRRRRASAIEPSFRQSTSASWAGRARGRVRSLDGLSWTSGFRATSSVTLKRGFGFRAGGASDMRLSTQSWPPGRGPGSRTMDARELTALFASTARSPLPGASRGQSSDPRPDADRDRRASYPGWSSTPVPGKTAAGESIPPRVFFQALRIAVNDELGPSRPDSPPSLAPARGPAAPRGPELPLPGGPHRQSASSRPSSGLHLPAEVPVCVCGRQPRLRSLGRSRTPGAAEIPGQPALPAVRVYGARSEWPQ